MEQTQNLSIWKVDVNMVLFAKFGILYDWLSRWKRRQVELGHWQLVVFSTPVQTHQFDFTTLPPNALITSYYFKEVHLYHSRGDDHVFVCSNQTLFSHIHIVTCCIFIRSFIQQLYANIFFEDFIPQTVNDTQKHLCDQMCRFIILL